MKTKASNSYGAEDLAYSAYNLFAKMRGLQRTWEQMDGDQAPWCEVAVLAINVIDLPESETASIDLSARELAENLYNRYCEANVSPAMWGSLNSNERLAWEAVGRHLANLIDSDGSLDFADMETKMLEWVTQRTTAEVSG